MTFIVVQMIKKDLSVRIKREVSEGNLNIRTTITISLLMTFSVILLGFFIHDRLQKFMSLPEDSFYSQLTPYPHFQRDVLVSSDFGASNSSISRATLEDWIAPKELLHSMSDKELLWRASMVPKVVEYPYNRTPKIAFMFLTKGRLAFAQLWEMFFKGHKGFYSIYVHTPPDYTYEPPESSVFYKRRIPSQSVQWGKKTMIDAERRLLANALLDHSNERFILLSESCIPIFNFTTIYNHITNSNQSFLGLFDDPRYTGRGRYNKRMWPLVSLSDWRKGSQWFEVQRALALTIISDSKFYPVFVQHCRPPCYMDEHYFPTIVNIICPQMTSNRSVTWVDWSRGGSHPATFVRSEISKDFFDHIRHGYNCTYNGQFTTMCHLFARKFHSNTVGHLLNLAPYLFGLNVSD